MPGNPLRRLREAEQDIQSLGQSFSATSYESGGSSDGAGLNPVPNPFDFIWAKIDGNDMTTDPDSGNTGYGWKEQTPLPGGTFQDADSGLSGSSDDQAAFEQNNATVADGSVVRLRKGSLYEADDGSIQQEWLFDIGDSGTPAAAACGCCCCCIPCSDGVWLVVGSMTLSGCGLPADAIGPFTLALFKDTADNCWKGSGTSATPAGYGTGTMTYTAKVCCDKNDLRHCPVLTFNCTIVITDGDYHGQYKFCIGPIDFRETSTSHILNCDQSDATTTEGTDNPPVGWSATLSLEDWGCDPNGHACQCRVNPQAGQSITMVCFCRSCPVTGIPSSFTCTVNCTAIDGTISTSFTMQQYGSIAAAGGPCSVGGDDYGQPCWYGESSADAHGCHMAMLLVCRPGSQEMAYCFGTIQDGGGNCGFTPGGLNQLLTECGFSSAMTTRVCCNPWGMQFSSGGPVIMTLGNPTC